MKYKDIKVGATFSFSRIITEEDGEVFAKLTGNQNPLHVSDEFAERSGFDKKIAYGLHVGSLFSTLIGMYCPGKYSVCLSQTLHFKKPVYYGDELTVWGEVVHKNDTFKIVTLKTEIIRESERVIVGEAEVKVLEHD